MCEAEVIQDLRFPPDQFWLVNCSRGAEICAFSAINAVISLIFLLPLVSHSVRMVQDSILDVVAGKHGRGRSSKHAVATDAVPREGQCPRTRGASRVAGVSRGELWRKRRV